jgi:AcrR family transcriptional regulator
MKRQKSSSAKYLRWDDRERNIVEKSIEYFSRHGFDASTRDVASYIGITQSLLYRYFTSKQALVDRVYKEIFILSWKSEWETIIKDRTKPLRARLIEYLDDYCNTILTRDWVRLFLFGALAETTINKDVIGRLHESIFTAILNEIYFDNNIDLPRSEQAKRLDMEIVWGFHSSFFYIGVRRWVYNLPVPTDLGPVIRARVGAFLDGVGKEFLKGATYDVVDPLLFHSKESV